MERKPIKFRCDISPTGHYMKGLDPPSLAVQIAHEIWRWDNPGLIIDPRAEPAIRAMANIIVRMYEDNFYKGWRNFYIKPIVKDGAIRLGTAEAPATEPSNA